MKDHHFDREAIIGLLAGIIVLKTAQGSATAMIIMGLVSFAMIYLILLFVL